MLGFCQNSDIIGFRRDSAKATLSLFGCCQESERILLEILQRIMGGFWQVSARSLLWSSWDSAGHAQVLLGFCQDAVRILAGFFWGSVRILLGFCWGAFRILLKFNYDSVRISLGSCEDSLENPLIWRHLGTFARFWKQLIASKSIQ